MPLNRQKINSEIESGLHSLRGWVGVEDSYLEWTKIEELADGLESRYKSMKKIKL